MGEAIDFVGYVTFFWAFILSKKFRQIQLEEWKSGGFVERVEIMVQAVTSATLGIGVLYAITTFLLSG